MTTDTPHILIVDDDREIRDLVVRFLRGHGLRVDSAEDGKAMRRAMDNGRFDLVILDVMMPGEDGLTLCRELRSRSSLPIIMLTALGEDTDRIVGLEMGADDYLAKPFNPRELLARIKAVLRRAGPGGESDRVETSGLLRFEGWSLDTARRELRDKDGVLVTLSAGEYDLLAVFATRPQRVLNRDQLLDLTRGREAAPFDRSVDVQLSRLRKKIEPDPTNPVLIKTIRGGGYMMAVPVTKE
ncbi:response regulator [Magnetospira sp. QH-2]|uniref:response regulator n=1 Tax=Magnetospira sp. (strain QH-2) TaxID=1288970 RepID=UPI0003E81B7A|nr:response regulator [Magnetospira sp. QH-2]CCQ74785.1 putative two component response transcriptional regulator [Magnetospira sp. QH-2]